MTKGTWIIQEFHTGPCNINTIIKMSKGQHSVARLFESGGLQLSKTSEHNYQWTEDNKKKLMDQSQPIVMAFVKVTDIQPKIK